MSGFFVVNSKICFCSNKLVSQANKTGNPILVLEKENGVSFGSYLLLSKAFNVN